jgi:inorganic pyrophosphatase
VPDQIAPQEASTIEPANSVDAFIEVPRGSRNKYEIIPGTEKFRLDRVLYSAVHYPGDYGFIPETLGGDGDPLDILVLVNEPTFPGCLIEARPLGGLVMTDEKGEDFKVLAVPVIDPRYDHLNALSQLGDHWLREIETFFATYKLLEGKPTEVRGWRDLATAEREIQESRDRYQNSSA